MRIVIEIDEHRAPAPPPEVSITRAGPEAPAASGAPGAPGAPGAAGAINAGMAAPLAEEGGVPDDGTAPETRDAAVAGALSAGAAPMPDDAGY